MMPGIASACGVLAAAGGYSATASPSSVSKNTTSYGGGSVAITTPATTVTVTGGTAAYTYSWAFKSGDAGISATSASAASTAFTATLAAGDHVSAIFECTVTDANGVATAADCDVTLNHVDLR